MAEEIIFTVNDTQEQVFLFVQEDTGGGAVDSVNGQTGVVLLQTDDVPENTNLYYTDARVSNNTDVAANTLKTGITPTQASDITTNNSKISYTDSAAVALNTAKVGYTDALVDANSSVVANTAKVGITAQQSTDITTNNSKVGVTNEQQNTINTEVEVGMTGEDLVLNVLSLTQAEYDAGTPIATTFYIITDA